MSQEIIPADINTPVSALLPWERMAGESNDAWSAFKQFRDAVPPRRQRSVIGFGTCSISEWYNQYRWVDRVDAYDRHLEKVYLAEREALLRESTAAITAKQMAMLNSAQHIAQSELDKHIKQLQENEAPLLRFADVVRLVEMTIKYGRLIRGQSTESVDNKLDLSGLSPDELWQLKKIQEKIQNGDVKH